MTNPKRNRDDEALRKRFVTGEQQAIDALARWITHPAVRPVIERRRIQAETVVMPIARHLVDQEQSARFCWRVFGIAGVGTDWNLRQGEPWWLTPDEANAIEEVEGAFRAVVQFTVDELAARGVGLAPSWAGDHAVVGELLLVNVPWELPARQLAAGLNMPPIGAIHSDASGSIVRRGIWERAESNTTALRRSYERHLHGPPPRAPYATGGTRALPEPTRRRREALRKVLQRWPDASASSIWTTFGDRGLQHGQQPRTPGGYLRQLLEECAENGQPVPRPAKSTLHADLKALRDTCPDQKPSG